MAVDRLLLSISPKYDFSKEKLTPLDKPFNYSTKGDHIPRFFHNFILILINGMALLLKIREKKEREKQICHNYIM